MRARLEPLVVSGQVSCARCGEPILPGQRWDLGHVDGDRSRYNGAEHARCNRATSARRPWQSTRKPQPELEPERSGLDARDERWRVPWLEEFLTVPPDAVWPRLMTVPHPRAADSLGPMFIADAEARTSKPLRWWQRLVATRLLEVDDQERLVWETIVLSMARQLGKSWLLRELCLWRIHQGDRFGEPQDVLHTGKDLAVCKEVQRPARGWAKRRPDAFKVREVNGQEEIEYLEDASRWMLRAKEAVYGYSVSFGAADEAWKVPAASIEEGLTPTMAERNQAQLLLVSTAHRRATTLMLRRRQVALADLEGGDGDLLIEWSAPAGAALDDVDAWRLASPHWTPRRERLISKQLAALRAGEIDDPEEPDPEQSYRAQWLNEWPRKVTEPLQGDELLPSGLWAEYTEPSVVSTDSVWVAVEDDYGLGAAVAAAALTDDGRIEVDGWLCLDWDTAIRDVRRLAEARQVRRLLVGASLLDRVPPDFVATPVPAGSRETRTALPLFRDLAAGGLLVHDVTTVQLDDAVNMTRVKESASGLVLVARGPTHLIRAMVWAVQAAHKPAPVPAVY
jgi:hypothetical protein